MADGQKPSGPLDSRSEFREMREKRAKVVEGLKKMEERQRRGKGEGLEEKIRQIKERLEQFDRLLSLEEGGREGDGEELSSPALHCCLVCSSSSSLFTPAGWASHAASRRHVEAKERMGRSGGVVMVGTREQLLATTCSSCGEEFPSRWRLHRHIISVHLATRSERCGGKDIKENSSRSDRASRSYEQKRRSSRTHKKSGDGRKNRKRRRRSSSRSRSRSIERSRRRSRSQSCRKSRRKSRRESRSGRSCRNRSQGRDSSKKPSSDQIKIEMTFERNELICLVGECGSNIKAIQEKTKALFHYPPKGSKSLNVIISGKPEDVKIAKDLVNKFINTSKEFEVMERQARVLVGVGGATIADLRKQAGVDIMVRNTTVKIYGSKERRAKTLTLINALFTRTGVPGALLQEY